MKKRILYLIPHLQNQGPVIQLLSLLRHLNFTEFEPTIATVFPERENSMLDQFANLGIRVACGNAGRWQILSQKEIIQKAIEQTEPDIIHSCSVITDSICASLKLHHPLMITLHNNIYEDVAVQYGKLIGGYLVKQEKKAISKATTVVPCSKTLGRQYRKIIHREYVPIPNGIETDQWMERPALSGKELREKLKLPQDRFILLSTGKLIERKKPITVIEAFVSAKLQKAILVMLGDGDLADQCKAAANEDVVFPGRVQNVKEYLYAADLLISASSAEGLPYAILEAECTGIRMILSDIPQHREAMGENAEKIRFFPVGNQEELKRLIRIEAGGGSYRNRYDTGRISAQAMAEKYMEEYRKMTGTWTKDY